MAITKALLPDTFMADSVPERKRLIVAVDGKDKQGKTHFILSAPKPLVYLDFDIGAEGVVEKAPGEDGIIRSKPFIFRPTESLFLAGQDASLAEKYKGKSNEAVVMELVEPELERFQRTYFRALREPVMIRDGKKLMARTIAVDTGSETWEMLRLAHLGKLSQVKSHHYTAVNAAMRDIVRAGFDSDVNVLWVHKLKNEWKDNAEGKGRKTEVLERVGFTEMAFLTQANLLCFRAPLPDAPAVTWKWRAGEGNPVEFVSDPRAESGDLGFRMRIGNSRHDPTLEGLELANDMVDFTTLATMMMPDVDPEWWKDSL